MLPDLFISLTLTTDNWADETGWTLKIGDETIDFVDVGSYLDFTTYSYDWSLPPGCYEFTITDTFGDGLCCGGEYGDGSYDLLFNGEVIVGGGGKFGFSETSYFGEEGKEFTAFYLGQVYTLGCDWISSQTDFPISFVCTYPDGDAGHQCPCVCLDYV